MKTANLLVSSVNITEDDYQYKGLVTLSDSSRSMVVDVADLETEAGIEKLKAGFSLEESHEKIKGILMQKVIEKAGISSRNIEGENYNEASRTQALERSAGSLDMA